MEKDKERDRNSLRECLREKGNKLEELIRVRKRNSKGESEKKRI